MSHIHTGIYPNRTEVDALRQTPGTRFAFWRYADGRKGYVVEWRSAAMRASAFFDCRTKRTSVRFCMQFGRNGGKAAP